MSKEIAAEASQPGREAVNVRQYQLRLRGHSLNPMIDAATPLLGMVLRLKNISSEALPEALYQQVAADVQSTEQLLQSQGYEPGAIVSFRYVLCTFIDEVALGHGWESENGWLKQSLLVRFHNETWGGEKVYVLLERLMGEAQRYRDLLEFIYLCFCLGFRGRYKVTSQHTDEFDRIFRRLYNVLRQMRPEAGSPLHYQGPSTSRGGYQLIKRLTIKQLAIGALAVLLLIYLFYALRLNLQTQDILQQLNGLLSGEKR